MENTVQYYVHGVDESTLEKAGHYKYEIYILKQLEEQLNFELLISTRPRDINFDADLYIARWATSGTIPVLISKLAGSPSMLYTGGSEIVLKSNKEFGNFYLDRPVHHRLIIQIGLRFASKVFVTSDYLATDIEKITGTRPDTLPHFIDTDMFSPGNPDLSVVPFDDTDYIVTTSWLSKDHIIIKRLELIMELLSESSYNLNLVLIGGDRGGRNQLQQRIDRLGITDQVHFLGNPSIDEKISVIQGARIALQPTLHEGFGMAILEALSCGTPVITSPNGAVEEVCGTAAHYTSATDINRMCADVESLWNDSELREEYSIKGRDRAENHFSLENGINQYKCILSELI